MKRRLSSYHAPAPICLGCALALLFACCREYKERKPTESVKSKPTVVTNLERAVNCGCAARELTFANVALETSTCERKVEAKDTIEAVKRELIHEASARGGNLKVVGVEEAAKLAAEAKRDSQFYALLIGRDGHLCGLLGSIEEIDGHKLYQVCHGDLGAQLLPRESLSNEFFQEAWLCSSESGGIPIQPGNGELRIDKAWINAGELRPLDELKYEFNLENTGNSTIVLGKPQTSCGCVVPILKFIIGASFMLGTFKAVI